jgi:hypothetical protein
LTMFRHTANLRNSFHEMTILLAGLPRTHLKETDLENRLRPRPIHSRRHWRRWSTRYGRELPPQKI